MSIARRNLFQDKGRLVLSVLGIALSIMLILILSGFLSGVYRQASSYLANTPGSVVVAQGGVTNFFGTSSVLSPGALEAAGKVQGTERIISVAAQIVIFEVHDKKQGAMAVGYDPGVGGGPWSMLKGRAPAEDDQLVVDIVLAEEHGIRLGDRLSLMGRDFTVVGLSGGTSMWAASLMFLRKGTLDSLLSVRGATSFLFVTPSAGVTSEALRDRLAGLPGLQDASVLLKSEMIDNDTQLFARVYTGPLAIMVLIAFLVGALVVGLVIYTATVERQREYGVLKAIGTRNGLLYRVITAQALIASATGSVLGVGFAYAVGQLIMLVRPQFLVAIEPSAVVWALLAGVVMALLGALFPARSIATLAPAEVFRR